MQILSTKNSETDSNKTNRILNPCNRPYKIKPCYLMPAYFDKYCWTHERGNHKGGNFNPNTPGYKEKVTTESKVDRSNCGCTE